MKDFFRIIACVSAILLIGPIVQCGIIALLVFGFVMVLVVAAIEAAFQKTKAFERVENILRNF